MQDILQLVYMKKIIFFTFSILLSNTLFGQSDSVLFEIHYKITQSGLTTKDLPTIRNSMVLISKNHSLEKDLDRFKADTSYAMKYAEKFFKANPNPNGEISDVQNFLSETMNNYGLDRQIFFDYEKKKYLYFRKMFQAYSYEVTLPKYKWKLVDSTQIIAGYECKKALGTSSSGYELSVWYCDAYHTTYNILGIGNLPGLIVKAVELKSNTTFEITHSQIGSKLFKSLMPKKSILTTKAEMTKLEQEFAKDRNQFFKDHPVQGVTITGN